MSGTAILSFFGDAFCGVSSFKIFALAASLLASVAGTILQKTYNETKQHKKKKKLELFKNLIQMLREQCNAAWLHLSDFYTSLVRTRLFSM